MINIGKNHEEIYWSYAILILISIQSYAQDESVNGDLTIGISGDAGNLRIRRGSDGNINGWLGFLGGGDERHNLSLQSTSGGGYITFRTNNGGIAERMRIANNGNIGIGTTGPDFKLDIRGTIAIGSSGEAGVLNFRRGSDGWSGAANIGFNGTNEAHNFAFKINSGSGYLTFYTNDNGSVEEKMRIANNGNVGIGTTETFGYKLAVNGTIGSTEVKVENTSNWPDFVFENDYELNTLEEVEKHINENGHLPETPNEAEVTKNGINLGEMNAKLLQKIEELTLYLIEQNKEIKELKELTQQQQADIERLKSE